MVTFQLREVGFRWPFWEKYSSNPFSKSQQIGTAFEYLMPRVLFLLHEALDKQPKQRPRLPKNLKTIFSQLNSHGWSRQSGMRKIPTEKK